MGGASGKQDRILLLLPPPPPLPLPLPSWDIDGIAGISATILDHEVRMAEEDRILGSLMTTYLLTLCVRINH